MARLPDFRSHLKSGPFETQPLFDPLKSRLVRISDPHFTLKMMQVLLVGLKNEKIQMDGKFKVVQTLHRLLTSPLPLNQINLAPLMFVYPNVKY